MCRPAHGASEQWSDARGTAPAQVQLGAIPAVDGVRGVQRGAHAVRGGRGVRCVHGRSPAMAPGSGPAAARLRATGSQVLRPPRRQARRACLLAGHQTARAGARKGRGRDPRPRRRLGSVGLDVKASLGRAGVCDWPAHRARALSALGLCGQGRTRKSAFCGEGTSASLADGGGRTGTWTAWSSSRIPSSSRRKNTSARWPCAMSSVSIRSEPHARADARRRPARAKDRVVQACEFHTTQALRSADSC